MRIAIVGTGFEGFLAAHAVKLKFSEDTFPAELDELTIFGPNPYPMIPGARFYERAIPVVNPLFTSNAFGKPETMEGISNGELSDYFKKVGANWANPIITPKMPATAIYSINGLYAYLYDHYNVHMNTGVNIHSGDFLTIQGNDAPLHGYDKVISTIPLPMWFAPEQINLFAALKIWRLDESVNESIPYEAPIEGMRNITIYDGTENAAWFRITRAFGLTSVEFPHHKKPPIQGTYEEIIPNGLFQPIKRAFFNWGGSKTDLFHVGRLGAWTPLYDPAEVFFETQDFLEGHDPNSEVETINEMGLYNV